MFISVAACRIAIAIVSQDPIVTDRPDFTESSLTVPGGMIQVETGATYENGSGASVIGAPEALIRFGQSDRLEWRLTIPNYFTVRTAGSTQRSWDAATAGLKWRLGPVNGTEMALIAATTLPMNENEFGTDDYEPNLKFCVARDVDKNTSLSAMLDATWIEGQTEYLATLSLGRGINDNLGIFVEYAGSFAKGSESVHVLHSGFVGLLGPDRQWDVHFGFDLEKPNRAAFVGIGYSFRF